MLVHDLNHPHRLPGEGMGDRNTKHVPGAKARFLVPRRVESYSISTYTTLGIGDIYFTGDARIISGIQAIIGLIMIAWSASHIYLKIKKEI